MIIDDFSCLGHRRKNDPKFGVACCPPGIMVIKLLGRWTGTTMQPLYGSHFRTLNKSALVPSRKREEHT